MNQHREGTAASRDRLGPSVRIRNGAAGGVALAAFLLCLAPLAGSASPHPATAVHSAPFLGMKVTTSNVWSKSGCGATKVLPKAFFYPRIGSGGFAAFTVARTCLPANGGASAYSSAYASTGFDLSYKMNFLHKGAHTISIALHLDLGGHASLARGACNPGTSTYYYCSMSYYGHVGGTAYLFDSTSGQYFFPSKYWAGLTTTHGLFSYYYNGGWANGSSMSSGPFFGSTWANISIPAKVITTHHYALLFSVGASLWSDESGYSMSKASLVVDMANHGHGILLASVSVS
jgi:hypothetical protein